YHAKKTTSHSYTRIDLTAVLAPDGPVTLVVRAAEAPRPNDSCFPRLLNPPSHKEDQHADPQQQQFVFRAKALHFRPHDGEGQEKHPNNLQDATEFVEHHRPLPVPEIRNAERRHSHF